VRGLLELVLEVGDLDRAVHFYRDVLGMAEVTRWPDERPAVWVRLGENETLGLWPERSGGPGVAVHGGRGARHCHFAVWVEPGSLDRWRDRLSGEGIEAESVDFQRGRSLFVDDPDGNVVELADWGSDWEDRPARKPLNPD
jgi:catechol 2,3-dioxygenase-like lactoylglutathione lyase family enzyme